MMARNLCEYGDRLPFDGDSTEHMEAKFTSKVLPHGI